MRHQQKPYKSRILEDEKTDEILISSGNSKPAAMVDYRQQVTLKITLKITKNSDIIFAYHFSLKVGFFVCRKGYQFILVAFFVDSSMIHRISARSLQRDFVSGHIL